MGDQHARDFLLVGLLQNLKVPRPRAPRTAQERAALYQAAVVDVERKLKALSDALPVLRAMLEDALTEVRTEQPEATGARLTPSEQGKADGSA